MARVYGWTVRPTQDDLICVPGMLAFGFTPAIDPIMELAQLFCEVVIPLLRSVCLPPARPRHSSAHWTAL